MSRIYDPKFVYTNSANTNIAKTFRRIRDAERKRKAEEALSRQRDPKPHIVPIRGRNG